MQIYHRAVRLAGWVLDKTNGFLASKSKRKKTCLALLQIGNMGRVTAGAAEQAAQHDARPSSPGAVADGRCAAKRAAMGMLVSLMRHSPQLAAAAADQGGLDAAVACLSEADEETREGAGGQLQGHRRKLWVLSDSLHRGVVHTPRLSGRMPQGQAPMLPLLRRMCPCSVGAGERCGARRAAGRTRVPRRRAAGSDCLPVPRPSVHRPHPKACGRLCAG